MLPTPLKILKNVFFFQFLWYNSSEVISMEKMVKTNIGEMPIEDYRDIKARQLGFEDYDDMYSQGYRLSEETEYTEKTR